jgi:formylglycine-generating enzyme required for sulfatase activity
MLRNESGEFRVEGYPPDEADERNDEKAGEDILRVLRGGAFNFSAEILRCSYRDWNYPDYRLINLGFRVVLSPF